MLLVETDLPAAAAVVDIERATAACTEAGASSVIQATDPQEADWLRQARRLALRALERLGTVRMEDVACRAAACPSCCWPSTRSARSTDPDRDVRPRRRRQPAPELHLRARRSAGRGAERSRPARPVPGGDRARRDDHGGARRRFEPAGVARRAGRARRARGSCSRSRTRSTRWASSTPAKSCSGGCSRPSAPAPTGRSSWPSTSARPSSRSAS